MPNSVDSISKAEWILPTRHGEVNLHRRIAVMGVLNVTPDSFSDGGRFVDAGKAIDRGIQIVEEGAGIVDVGGESTRPGARIVSVEEELERVIPVIRGLRRVLSVPISIDTYKVEVARRALEHGADIVNDISALTGDPEMASLVARERVPVVLMHMQGTPQTMQLNPQYGNVLQEVTDFLRHRVVVAAEKGVDPGQIIIDPGIGFGKSLEHNLILLRGLSQLAALGQPLMVGASRKTFIGKILNAPVEDRSEGSLAAAVAAVLAGANIIRVHDVRETCKAIRIAEALRFGAPVPGEQTCD
jgi:dihydropteroate synthase